MKVFEKNGKVNFVDKYNAVLGFDHTADCCENFGYVVLEQIPQRLSYTEMDGWDDLLSQENLDLGPYIFDVDIANVKPEAIRHWEAMDAGGAVPFQIRNEGTGRVLYLLIYNEHNGYYSHGFKFEVGGEKILDDTI